MLRTDHFYGHETVFNRCLVTVFCETQSLNGFRTKPRHFDKSFGNCRTAHFCSLFSKFPRKENHLGHNLMKYISYAWIGLGQRRSRCCAKSNTVIRKRALTFPLYCFYNNKYKMSQKSDLPKNGHVFRHFINETGMYASIIIVCE